MSDLARRTSRYVMEPDDYGIAGCPCGNEACEWSEFEERLWCARCAVDFVPAHWGMFDGPIPVQAAALLGISFERVELGPFC